MPVSKETLLQVSFEERRQLLAYIHGIVHDYHLAEDVVQEAVVAALKRLEHIDSRQHLVNWLRMTARHRAIDQMRRRRRMKEVLSESALDALQQAWETRPVDRETCVERFDALTACVGKLSEYGQRLVELRYRQGVKGEDLADAMGKPLNTVMVALARVNKQLSRCVRAQMTG
jgi:RNA polymerase sigma-70 factor (ECF subfamily)